MVPEILKAKRRYRTEDVARILGISKRTLCRYEKKGIFPVPSRNPINGWREYSEEDIGHLRMITGA
jgi:DNA-binding transcriptional MerR regulator